jgi:aldehyde dehydrogenase (NAD+)
MAENLEMRYDEIAQRLTDMTGCTLDDSKAEVDAAIERLFHYGAYADKYGGTVQVEIPEGTHCVCTVGVQEEIGGR